MISRIDGVSGAEYCSKDPSKRKSSETEGNSPLLLQNALEKTFITAPSRLSPSRQSAESLTLHTRSNQAVPGRVYR